MSYANNSGVRIHYEVVGNGPPLIMLHGLTDSIEVWKELGYVDALKNDYKLILVDARGHGKSDKPHDSAAYQFKNLVLDVLAVMDDLKIERAHYWGYSMGARVGWNSVKHNLHGRFISLVLGGDSPQAWKAPFDELIKNEGVTGWVAYLEEHFGPLPEVVKARMLTNDAKAIYAFSSWEWPDITDILPTMTMPCLVYAGEGDEMEYPTLKEYVKRIPSPTVFWLPGLDHFATHARSDLVLPHVKAFLAKASR